MFGVCGSFGDEQAGAFRHAAVELRELCALDFRVLRATLAVDLHVDCELTEAVAAGRSGRQLVAVFELREQA